MSKHLEKLKPLSSLLKKIEMPYLNASSAIGDFIEAKMVDNFLICIDDLERKEDSISGSSVLGLISQLKEEKSCKIVLIYNDEELDEETKNQINEYREKVVDLELIYSPTIDDNLSIIWPSGCPQCVSETFHALGLNNIRIMQRVRWTLDYFSDQIREKYPNLYPAFQAKCAMLTVLHHAYGKLVSMDEILSTSYYSILLSKDEKRREKLDALRKLRFMREEQDVVIAEYLLGGHVDLSRFSGLMQEKDEQYRLSDITEKHRDIWSKYHYGFCVTQDEFIGLEAKFLEDHGNDLGVQDVASAVSFIRKLDEDINLDPLLEESIDLFVSKVDKVDVEYLKITGMDLDTIQRIQEKLSGKARDYSITESFVALAGGNGWNPKDIRYLVRYTEDDFFSWIISEDSVSVIGLLREFLRRFGSRNEDERGVVDRVMAALERVRERSPIDRCRVDFLIKGVD